MESSASSSPTCSSLAPYATAHVATTPITSSPVALQIPPLHSSPLPSLKGKGRPVAEAGLDAAELAEGGPPVPALSEGVHEDGEEGPGQHPPRARLHLASQVKLGANLSLHFQNVLYPLGFPSPPAVPSALVSLSHSHSNHNFISLN